LGAGGLGSPAALYLAAAGVGTIGIIDDDVVDDSNLQRQIVHSTDRLGEPKVTSAKRTVEALNADVTVIPFEERLTSENVERVLADGWDVILDGTDNFPTRYLVNDASVWHGIPVVHGSIYRFEGQVTVFHPGNGPCYRCLYPTPPPPELAPSCAEGGVLGVLPGIVGSLQASEALKLLLGAGESLAGRLLLFDALHTTFDEVLIRRNPECPVCGDHPTITEYIDYVEFCTGAPGVHAWRSCASPPRCATRSAAPDRSRRAARRCARCSTTSSSGTLRWATRSSRTAASRRSSTSTSAARMSAPWTASTRPCRTARP